MAVTQAVTNILKEYFMTIRAPGSWSKNICIPGRVGAPGGSVSPKTVTVKVPGIPSNLATDSTSSSSSAFQSSSELRFEHHDFSHSQAFKAEGVFNFQDQQRAGRTVRDRSQPGANASDNFFDDIENFAGAVRISDGVSVLLTGRRSDKSDAKKTSKQLPTLDLDPVRNEDGSERFAYNPTRNWRSCRDWPF